MKKLIYLDDAIDVIKKHYRICDDLLEVISYEDLFEVIAHEIERLPSAEPEQRWIPVSKRLPDEGERVLCTHTGGLNPNRQVIEHIYQNGKFTLGWDMDMNPSSPTFGQRYMGTVIAWMPLPEPYREDGEAE